jgi:hypothetical protein
MYVTTITFFYKLTILKRLSHLTGSLAHAYFEVSVFTATRLRSGFRFLTKADLLASICCGVLMYDLHFFT